jgi:hypothetical protein
MFFRKRILPGKSYQVMLYATYKRIPRTYDKVAEGLQFENFSLL